MAKVYVTQEVPSANYSEAEKYGDVVFLCTAELSNSPSSLHNTRMVNAIRERMKDYDPKEDYIAPSGSPILACIAASIASEKSDVIRFLKWGNRDYKYTPIIINIQGDPHVI